ncbi:hypothetical protein UFOVP225_46 [uncultured Caudovirales phage]|uniref:Uncharacterized protein n=1 Tax=uncultured Caudovirales phage TaxID=2100421 RepID=A0A6J7WR56_9CAUD|nr:hypothetical protein UFOVP113_59 [uncultured Caudovirales phage]CAB5219255.1 hypothetical protein UFOVP225_46 [uncultured Caudovirales phage]
MPEMSEWEKYKADPDGYSKSLADSRLGENNRPARPWDLINPHTEYVTKEEAAIRLDICKSCPELIQGLLQCKQCGCFMKAKTMIKHAECPLHKW